MVRKGFARCFWTTRISTSSGSNRVSFNIPRLRNGTFHRKTLDSTIVEHFVFFLFCYRLHRFLQRRTLRQMIEGRGKKKKQKKTAECARRREADPPIRGGRFKGTLSTRPSGRNSGITPKKIDVEGKDSPPGFINVNRVRITKALKKKEQKLATFFLIFGASSQKVLRSARINDEMIMVVDSTIVSFFLF